MKKRKDAVDFTVDRGRIKVKDSPRKGLNHVRCGCGGVKRRQADNSLTCDRCSVRTNETPL